MAYIYLDHHATTPVSPAVRAAVAEAMDCCGNAASGHMAGKRAAELVECARRSVAGVIGAAHPEEIVFTSGATEANNLALRGVLDAYARDRIPRRRVITTPIEHSSVLHTLRELARRDRCELVLLPCGRSGIVRASDVDAALNAAPDDVALVSVMAANNEIGTIQPIREIGEVCARRGVPLHVDACQAFAKIPLCAGWFQLLSASAHKLRGPTGVGLLYVDPRLRHWIEPQQTGGTHEGGTRAGTANVQGEVGFGAAAREAMAGWRPAAPWIAPGSEAHRLMGLRDRLVAALMGHLGDDRLRVNGALDLPTAPGAPVPAAGRKRLPHNLNVTLIGVCPDRLYERLVEHMAVSHAAACKALGGERSHVLTAIGAPDDGAVLRFGLGADTTSESIDRAAELVLRAADELYGTGCPLPPRRATVAGP